METIKKNIRATYLGYTNLDTGTIAVRLNEGICATIDHYKKLHVGLELLETDSRGMILTHDMNILVRYPDCVYTAFTPSGIAVKMPKHMLDKYRSQAVSNGDIFKLALAKYPIA